MNERIRKLAERAGFSYMPRNYPDMADLYECADFEMEKFAELIVRECIDYCGENLSKTVGGALKIHFGVEA